jgi:RNA polymerase sigma-70 factor, ECF subfamily
MTTAEKRPLEHPDFDESMVEEARTGGPDAFHPIFNRFSKPILMFIYSLIGDRERAEELTQETFIRAYHGLHTFRESGRFSTWLFGIARNVVREAIRAKYRNSSRLMPFELISSRRPDTKAKPDEQVISEELYRMIRQALLKLPEDQRVVFVLKLITSMRYEEISEITGASIGKLKTDLHRARHRMREELQPYLQGRLYGKTG